MGKQFAAICVWNLCSSTYGAGLILLDTCHLRQKNQLFLQDSPCPTSSRNSLHLNVHQVLLSWIFGPKTVDQGPGDARYRIVVSDSGKLWNATWNAHYTKGARWPFLPLAIVPRRLKYRWVPLNANKQKFDSGEFRFTTIWISNSKSEEFELRI